MPTASSTKKGEMMNDRIPAEARAAIHAELNADTAGYRDDVPQGEWTKPNRGPSPLLTLRIPSETLEALQALAAANEVSVSTLARGFIADGLASHQDGDLRAALARLERDVAEVKARALG